MNEEQPAAGRKDHKVCVCIRPQRNYFRIRFSQIQHGPTEVLQKGDGGGGGGGVGYLEDKIWLSASEKLLPRARDG